MNQSNKLLADLVAFGNYAKWLSVFERREVLEETINRDMQMHLEMYPKLSRDIIKAFQRVHEGKVMPSMRAMQFGGEAILKNHIRQYNCSFLHIDDPRAFGEVLYLLLCGTGVGYSVQKRHISKLPSIKLPKEEGSFFVHDSIEGWAQSLDILMEAYFYRRIRPNFNFSGIRKKGSYLVTTGAKAPGPEPLKKMLEQVEKVLKGAIGRQLTSFEVHCIQCIVADCVLVGGIRRAAEACLFDADDKQMRECKSGNWWEKHPYLARCNNSALLHRQTTTYEQYSEIFDACINSNAGEPGIKWTNDFEWGTNPCFEIALNSNQFCNLSTINQTGIKDKKDYLNRVYAAALIGTLQAGYTDFPYLRPSWKEVTEREALIGVSKTGIADSYGQVTAEWLQEGANLVKEVNQKYAKKIGINPAARTTAIKPEGTASCVLGSSSGIHARHSEFYYRRIRKNRDDNLVKYLQTVIPELIEQDVMDANTLVITIPQASPPGAILRENEGAIQLFNRVVNYYDNWILPGHISGANTHNVSVTITYKPEEIIDLKQTLWDYRHKYAAVSLLPFDGHTYKQAPFEACTKEEFEACSKLVKDIDLRQVKEVDDNTNRLEQVACSGGVCEIV